jgi:peptidoglycan/xylan/chitin deacetylase (PgdA/CDA1 family)
VSASFVATASRVTHELLKYSGVTALALRWQAGRLPILMYHGVCPDALAKAPWMPTYFTTVGAFARQMRFVRERCQPLDLLEAVAALGAGRLPRHAVVVSFDDGYANNVTLAGAILGDLGIPAVIFVTTGHTATGELYNHDRLRLVRHWQRSDGTPPLSLDLRALSVEEADRSLAPHWERLRGGLTADQKECLRPLTWAELAAAPSVLSWGAHTVRHAVLSREDARSAEREIVESVEDLRARTGRTGVPFAYPNGQPADFADRDVAILRRLGVPCAVTTSGGRNTRDTSRYHLRRYPVTLGHTQAAFEAELAGIRQGLARFRG